MKKALIALIAGAMTIGLMGVSPVTAQETDGDAAPACDGRWPATVKGKPRSFDRDRTAYYVWHDRSGWHLAVTNGGERPKRFTGEIVASNGIRATLVRDERGDSLDVDGRTLTYTLHTLGGVDGILFGVGCSDAITFTLEVNGRLVPPHKIRLGATGPAPANPFTIYRR